ncbi:DUF3894 domain-containing protein [Aliivibrio finisterrensis]
MSALNTIICLACFNIGFSIGNFNRKKNASIVIERWN